MSSRKSSGLVSRRDLLALAAAAQCVTSGVFAENRHTKGSTSMARFDRDRFVEDCVMANREADGQAAVREVLERAVDDPAAVIARLGAPTQAGLDVLHRSPALTIFAAHWAPRMSLPPHDHRLWALIGLCQGREDNIHWRRREGRLLEAHGANVLFPGDVAALTRDAIHSVTNPLPGFTTGIHIYGGDFFDTPRSQWSPDALAEEPSDGKTIKALFDRENERLGQGACRE